ncbi:DUF4396 domain-containing protein [Paraburkholderia sp. D1E]|uniref:DUF4396 domain-containing protein n=1 Tax=Paraburkholderia sp. D1E TaxID=3461398 RepID=UPI00404533F0
MSYGTFPAWLHDLSTAWISLGAICTVVIAADEVRHPQKMWIMNLVWPLTALFRTVFWLTGYCAWGRNASTSMANSSEPPFAAMVMNRTSHCGVGCTLGDIITEWAAFAFPAGGPVRMAQAFRRKNLRRLDPGFHRRFPARHRLQYFTIKPMRGLSVGRGVIAAVKADFASITGWQIGMYGCMAIVQFLWLRPLYGGVAGVASPKFWFAMQFAMPAGFATRYPVKWWLIRLGVKEKM